MKNPNKILPTDDQVEQMIVKKLQNTAPKVELRKGFKEQLRAKLLDLSPLTKKHPFNFINYFTSMNKFVLVPLLVVIVLAAAGSGYWFAVRNPVTPVQLMSNLTKADYAVASVGDNSFGSLKQLASTNVSDANKDAVGQKESINYQVAANTTGMGGAAGIAADIAPPGTGIYIPEYYSFEYVGEDITDLLAKDQPVYKRTKQDLSSNYLDQILRNFSFGLIDLSKLDGAKLQNYSLIQDQEYGFSSYVDLVEQTVSINQNWEKWPNPYACNAVPPIASGEFVSTTPACNPPAPLELKDMPEDQVVVDAAKEFLNRFDVSLSGYGEPVVDNNWRVQYDNLKSNKTSYAYIPEVLDIVFPYNIEGKSVYEEYGNMAGLHVNYSIRDNKVTGFYDLRSRQYQQSKYAGVTDANKVQQIAERGGFRNYNDYNLGDGAKKTILKLQTPTVQIMRFWKYENNTNTELFVPALVYPIENRGNYWRSNVIVPLVNDVLDGENYQGGPVPLSAGAASESPKVVLPGSSDTVEPN